MPPACCPSRPLCSWGQGAAPCLPRGPGAGWPGAQAPLEAHVTCSGAVILEQACDPGALPTLPLTVGVRGRHPVNTLLPDECGLPDQEGAAQRLSKPGLCWRARESADAPQRPRFGRAANLCFHRVSRPWTVRARSPPPPPAPTASPGCTQPPLKAQPLFC